jgi:hypothetical protein
MLVLKRNCKSARNMLNTMISCFVLMKTKIEICQKTKDELKKYGNKDSTWDQIIIDLLNHVCICDKYWENKKWNLL